MRQNIWSWLKIFDVFEARPAAGDPERPIALVMGCYDIWVFVPTPAAEFRTSKTPSIDVRVA